LFRDYIAILIKDDIIKTTIKMATEDSAMSKKLITWLKVFGILDEDTLKESDISTLKTLFTGYNSYASQILQKASSISNAAASAGGTYTSSGTYNSVLSSAASTKVDTEV
jgi:ribosomal protein L17